MYQDGYYTYHMQLIDATGSLWMAYSPQAAILNNGLGALQKKKVIFFANLGGGNTFEDSASITQLCYKNMLWYEVNKSIHTSSMSNLGEAGP